MAFSHVIVGNQSQTPKRGIHAAVLFSRVHFAQLQNIKAAAGVVLNPITNLKPFSIGA
jgi:hypothetical protein